MNVTYEGKGKLRSSIEQQELSRCGACIMQQPDIIKKALADGKIAPEFAAYYSDKAEGEDRALVTKHLFGVFDGVGGNGAAVSDIAQKYFREVAKEIPPVATLREIKSLLLKHLMIASGRAMMEQRKHINQNIDTTLAIIVFFVDRDTQQKTIAVLSVGDSQVLEVAKDGSSIKLLNKLDSFTW